MKFRALATLLLLLASSAMCAEDVVLGVLEDVPGVYAGDSNNFKVRALFLRKTQSWIAYKSHCDDPSCLSAATAQYPKEMKWFIGFNGQVLGEVKTQAPRDFGFYARIGLLDIVDGKPPVVGNPSSDYAGFDGQEVHRPLVADSKPNFSDPAGWKPAKVTTSLRKRASALLRKMAPAICVERSREVDSLVPFDYSSKALVIRAYRSHNGRLVLTANAKNALYCSPKAGDGSYDDQSFGLDRDGKAHFLGSGLSLIDTGDYDLDGKSELMFALSTYDRGGYVLVSDDFKQEARFDFIYH